MDIGALHIESFIKRSGAQPSRHTQHHNGSPLLIHDLRVSKQRRLMLQIGTLHSVPQFSSQGLASTLPYSIRVAWK